MTNVDTLINQIRAHGIDMSPEVEAAFRSVDRLNFIPEAASELAHSDQSIAVRLNLEGEALCSATMPSMLAFMLELMEIEDGMNVLQIGTGTGYMAALIRAVMGDNGTITSLEIDPDITRLAEDNLNRIAIHNIHLVTVDGAKGYSPRAAYDRIVASTGVWDIPPEWIQQLKPRGKIIAPVIIDGLQVTAAFTLQADGSIYADTVMPSAFVYIRGSAAAPLLRKRIGSSMMSLLTDDAAKIDAIALATLLSQDHEAVQLSTPLDTHAYWYGFLPYLMLHESQNNIFALYHIPDGYKAYEMEGEGFVLLTPASACFVPYYGRGFVHSFAGADAFLELENYLKDWEREGKPSIEQLRLRFIPMELGAPEISRGRPYPRRDHILHVWLETEL